jgi:segregation and condensation protein A
MTNTPSEFTEDAPRHDTPALDPDALLLNLDGFEGPIDVLLQLARDQKVDLAKISILQLTRQFLGFIERAKQLRLDLASEYLVMAAWLAYLKSRLLLPKSPNAEDEPSAEAMADALAYQLRRLEAMQTAAKELTALAQRDRDFFARGHVEPSDRKVEVVWTATLYDLLKAYGDIRARKERGKNYELPRFHLMSMDDAMDRMVRMLGALPKTGPHTAWTTLISFLPPVSSPIQDRHPGRGEAETRDLHPQDGQKVPARAPAGLGRDDTLYMRSSLASLLTATLEMAKQGNLELRQDGPFRPIYLRGVDGVQQAEDAA